jgi:hypothetical protein
MENLSDSKKNDVLPEFQTFLLEKKLTPEKNVFFYALWVSKYFTYARKKQISSDQYQENAVIEFLKTDPNMSDWQIRQAGDAIRLYYFHYRGLKPNNLSGVKSSDFTPELLKETQRLIRLKHYSYSTEKTYLQWIKRFLEYSSQTSKKDASIELDTADCKNFLSYLALKEKCPHQLRIRRSMPCFFFFAMCFAKRWATSLRLSGQSAGRNCPLSSRWKRSNDCWPV